VASGAGEARYRHLFEESPHSIWEADWSAVKSQIDRLHGSGIHDLRTHFHEHQEAARTAVSKVKVIDFNKATLEIFRAPDKETVRRGLRDFMENSYRDGFAEAVCALAEGKAGHTLECRARAFDGSELFVRITRQVPEEHQDTWSLVIETVEDITERKRAERLNTRLGRIVEDSVNEIYVFDSKTLRFVQVNRGARENLGYSMEELRELTPPRHQARLPAGAVLQARSALVGRRAGAGSIRDDTPAKGWHDLRCRGSPAAFAGRDPRRSSSP
jgi:PAS domain S-box-containing protein